MSGSSFEHQEQAKAHAKRQAVRCAVLTVSDTRTVETDTGGATIITLLEQAGFAVHERCLVKDEPGQIASKLQQWAADPAVHVILTTGGTGIAKRDTTIEVVRRLLTAELEGFGELFRMLSWAEVGAASMMSRAVGGLIARESHDGGDTFIFAMPGSVNAVETAMTKLIVPQLAHLVWERRK